MFELPCISLWQPWATLVVHHPEAKPEETRPMKIPRTLLGTPVGIHAAQTKKGFDIVKGDHAVGRELAELGIVLPELPLGALLGVVRFEEAVPTDEYLGAWNLFGDFTPGRWAWPISEVQPFSAPLTMSGSQGVFYVPASPLVPPVKYRYSLGDEAEFINPPDPNELDLGMS